MYLIYYLENSRKMPLTVWIFSKPVNFVEEYSSIKCLMVCSRPKLHKGDSAIHHLWNRWLHLSCSVLIRFMVVHKPRERLKPSVLTVGSSISDEFHTSKSNHILLYLICESISVVAFSHMGYLSWCLLIERYTIYYCRLTT